MDTLTSSIVYGGIGLLVYLFLAYCVMVIAQKLDVNNGWLAFIPFANIYLWCKMADISGWYMLLQFVPIANIVLYAYLWWKISERRERPAWYGILIGLFYPSALILFPVLAFTEGHHMPRGAMPHA